MAASIPYIVYAVVTIGIAAYSYFSAKSQAKKSYKYSGSDYLLNTTSSQQPLPLIFGQCRIGINKTFVYLNNPYLHIIAELGEGPIHGIVRQDGTIYTTTDSALPSSNPPLVYLDSKLFTKYDDNVVIRFYNGSAIQSVSSSLNSATGGKWDQTLHHTAYLYVRLKYDRDVFQSEPDITVVVQGLEIYNPITTVTEYTNNPALCAYEYITRSAKRGGIGIATSKIDLTSLSDAIDYCTAKGWTCNMPLIENQPCADNLDSILINFRGGIIKSGSSFKIKFSDLNYESYSMVLDENDIIAVNDQSSLEIQLLNTIDRPNAIKINYIDQDIDYQINTYILSDKDAIDEEGDYRETEIDILGLNRTNVAKMANYMLERLRWNKPIQFVAGERCKGLEPLDLIKLSHDFPGWSDKKMRIVSIGVKSDNTVSLNCIEEDDFLYDDIYNLIDRNFNDTDLPDPYSVPPSVVLGSPPSEEEVYYYRGRSFTRLIIDFEGPSTTVFPWWDYAEIWLQIGESGDFQYQTRSSGPYVIDPVQEGEYYAVKMRSVSSFGVKESLNDCAIISKIIVGKTSLPADLESLTAIASGDTITLFANSDKVEADRTGFEVRFGDSWVGGIYYGTFLDSMVQINNVRPGTFTWWMSPIDNLGHYSENPVSATCTIFIPPGYVADNTYSCDYDGIGTHSNTEHIIYNAEDALKVSHISGLYYLSISGIRNYNYISTINLSQEYLSFSLSDITNYNYIESPAVSEIASYVLSILNILNSNLIQTFELTQEYNLSISNILNENYLGEPAVTTTPEDVRQTRDDETRITRDGDDRVTR